MPVHSTQVKIEHRVQSICIARQTHGDPDPRHQPTDQMTSVYRRNEIEK